MKKFEGSIESSRGSILGKTMLVIGDEIGIINDLNEVIKWYHINFNEVKIVFKIFL